MGQHRILIVEDNAELRRSVREALDPTFTIEDAANAAEAVERVHHGSFDLVLLDAHLPGMDAPDFMRELREWDPSLLVIVTTSYSTPENTVRAIEEAVFRKQTERDFIVRTLRAYKGRINQTALHTRIPKKALLLKLKKYEIQADDFC